MNEIIIRRIEASDDADIQVLNEQLGHAFAKEDIHERIISILETGNDILLVAEVAGHVVGYAHGSPYETLYANSLLNTIAFVVLEGIEDQREIADQLYIAFEAMSKQFGFKGIRLALDTKREMAQQLFTNHGFISRRNLTHYIKYFE